ncbi:MAG: family rane protein, partial [Citricoccus sp.]|nr:family rane protein [Citricoccus sp. WCRC_4]
MPPEDVFEPYGPSHWGALAVCVLGAVIVVSVGRRLRGSGAEVVFSRVFAVVLAVYALA